MNIDELIKRAILEPTLEEGLALIAIWEMERIVKYVKANPDIPWDSCFRTSFKMFLKEYNEKQTAHQ